MEDLKKDSIGDYSCEMTYFDILESISKTIISTPIRLTSKFYLSFITEYNILQLISGLVFCYEEQFLLGLFC